MFNLKLLIIACSVTALLSGAVCGVAIWKNRTNHYQQIIDKEHAAIAKTLSDMKSQVIIAERKLQDASTQLEKAYFERDKAKSDLEHSLAQYRNEHGRLLVRGSCKANSSASSQASSSNQAGSSSDSNGSCELSRVASEALTQLAIQAQELRNRTETCKEYAEAVDKQREELSKDK